MFVYVANLAKFDPIFFILFHIVSLKYFSGLYVFLTF